MNDLPIFAKITELYIIVDYPLVKVNVCHTVGISNHLMSYQLDNTLQSSCVALSTLADTHPHTAHTFDDGNLFITLRSHVEAALLKTITYV